MSRIHDALMRAQQERAGLDGASSMAAPAEMPLAPPEPRAVAAPEPSALLTSAPEQPGGLTYDQLERRCAVRAWSFAVGRNVSASDDNARGLEELRTLRTRLYQVRGNMPLKIVLIASSLPGEGKTFLSCTLPQMIVRQRGRRALLIDGDLRLPRLHQEFGAPSSPGLSDYLKGDVDECAALQRGPVEGLMLMAGGTEVANPAELLAGNGLRRLVDRVAPCFDWVFIDSPAAVPIADANMIANVCDGVLMVVKAGSTPYDLAQRARNEFRHKPIVGVVLNRVEAHTSYSSYYYRRYGDQARKGAPRTA